MYFSRYLIAISNSIWFSILKKCSKWSNKYLKLKYWCGVIVTSFCLRAVVCETHPLKGQVNEFSLAWLVPYAALLLRNRQKNYSISQVLKLIGGESRKQSWEELLMMPENRIVCTPSRLETWIWLSQWYLCEFRNADSFYRFVVLTIFYYLVFLKLNYLCSVLLNFDWTTSSEDF